MEGKVSSPHELIVFFNTAELVILMLGALTLLGITIYKIIKREIKR